jgi:hypothetical protein
MYDPREKELGCVGKVRRWALDGEVVRWHV